MTICASVPFLILLCPLSNAIIRSALAAERGFPYLTLRDPDASSSNLSHGKHGRYRRQELAYPVVWAQRHARRTVPIWCLGHPTHYIPIPKDGSLSWRTFRQATVMNCLHTHIESISSLRRVESSAFFWALVRIHSSHGQIVSIGPRSKAAMASKTRSVHVS